MGHNTSWHAERIRRRMSERASAGTALAAGYRWLEVYCAGCDQVKPVDLAAIDIRPPALPAMRGIPTNGR